MKVPAIAAIMAAFSEKYKHFSTQGSYAALEELTYDTHSQNFSHVTFPTTLASYSVFHYSLAADAHSTLLGYKTCPSSRSLFDLLTGRFYFSVEQGSQPSYRRLSSPTRSATPLRTLPRSISHISPTDTFVCISLSYVSNSVSLTTEPANIIIDLRACPSWSTTARDDAYRIMCRIRTTSTMNAIIRSRSLKIQEQTPAVILLAVQ